MTRLIVSRLLQAVTTLAITSIFVFVLARTSGSPADLVLSQDATPSERVAYIKHIGLDKPLPYQYGVFVLDALHGDFGNSLRTGAPATKLVFERLPRTLLLASAATVFAVLVSVPLGVAAALHRGRLWDRLSMGFALLGQSVPSFWLGVVLILIFSVWLRWLPSSGVGSWTNYLMPSVVLGWSISAGIVRLLRSSMLEVLDRDFITLAHAKGLAPGTVIWKHALRNALIPVVTFVGFMYGVVITSGIVVEVVFGWPGLGLLAYESTLWRDFPVLQLTVLVYTAIIVFVNFLVDISYGIIDPRVRD